MTLSALVIHSDEKQLRFACEALVMFHPGYRVSTAGDLDTAGEWLDALAPDLIILEALIADPETLSRWANDHRLESQRTVLYGRSGALVEELGFATVSEPVKLPDLMATVRRGARPDTMHGPPSELIPKGTNR